MTTKHRRAWSEGELTILRNLYPTTATSEIARRLDRSDRSVYTQAYLLGLRKSEAYLLQVTRDLGKKLGASGMASRFQSGVTAWNKGKKGVNGKSSTVFKSGHRPHNALPIGSERISKDGYIERKVAEPNGWKSVHAILWEEQHGPIPKSHVVAFRDGNNRNFDTANLELVSRRALMDRNTVHRLPEELKSVINVKKQITRHINRTERGKHVAHN